MTDTLHTALITAIDTISDQELRDPETQCLVLTAAAINAWVESPNPDGVPDRLIRELLSLMRDAELHPVPRSTANQVALLVDCIESAVGSFKSEGQAFRNFTMIRQKLAARLNSEREVLTPEEEEA